MTRLALADELLKGRRSPESVKRLVSMETVEFAAAL